MLEKGEGIKVDKELAAEYYIKASNLGDVNSMLNYASMQYNNLNKEEAIKYYKMAMEKSSNGVELINMPLCFLTVMELN